MHRILVASDTRSVREELIAALGGTGTVVEEVASGDDALGAVHRDAPDILVVDLQITSMGGMAVCMDLRLDESVGAAAHVPVLMLLDRRADVFLARRSGAEGWVVKPLDPIRLRRAARALLGGGTFHDDSYMPVPAFSSFPSGSPSSGSPSPD